MVFPALHYKIWDRILRYKYKKVIFTRFILLILSLAFMGLDIIGLSMLNEAFVILAQEFSWDWQFIADFVMIVIMTSPVWLLSLVVLSIILAIGFSLLFCQKSFSYYYCFHLKHSMDDKGIKR